MLFIFYKFGVQFYILSGKIERYVFNNYKIIKIKSLK